MDLEILRRSAAEIAAAAVFELYPDVELLSSGPTAVGFSCEFLFPHPVHTHIIEEKMRQIVREKRVLRTLEMVPFSASELLKSKGLHSQASELDEADGLVEVVQIGEFHNLSPGPHIKNTAELAAFKIEASALPDQKMSITGWCHNSKEALKQFLKQLATHVEPAQIGEGMGLWKGDVWLPKGLELREKLVQFLKREWFNGAYQISAPLDADPFKTHRLQGQNKVAEICQKGHRDTEMRISFFAEMNSCLHLIGKTLTILGFDHSTIPMGFAVEDGIGRERLLVRVEKGAKGCMVIAYVEQILDQMLEKNLWVQLEN